MSYSQSNFKNVPILWTGNETIFEGDNITTFIQVENRHNTINGNNGWLTRLMLVSSGKFKVGGGLVITSFDGIEQIRLNQVFEYEFHRILAEEMFTRGQDFITRIRYRALHPIKIGKKKRNAFLVGVEPFFNISRNGLSVEQSRCYLMFDFFLHRKAHIRFGWIPEFFENRVNHILSAKIHLNF